jgi:hypothetical protein
MLAALLDSPRWKGIMAYVASSRSAPLYYIQTIAGGVGDGPPDPQIQLHSDTFHPSMKAWLFLTDVADDGRPLTYVAGSHRLTPERAAWERARSAAIADADRLSQRGSLRIAEEELAGLGLPPPTRFAVPPTRWSRSTPAASTPAPIPTIRRCGSNCGPIAAARRSCRGREGDLLSWRPIAIRRADGWLGAGVDWLAARGWMVQHWRRAGRRRPIEP